MRELKFEIGDVVQVKKECLLDDEKQEDTIKVVVDLRPDNKYYMLLCELNQPNKRICTMSTYYELVSKGDSVTKTFADDVRKTLPSEEENEKAINDLRNYIFSIAEGSTKDVIK